MHYKCNEKTVKLVDVTQQVTPRIVEIWPNLKIEAEAFQIANCLKCFQNILNDNPKEFLDAQKRVKGIVREKKWELLFSSKVLFNDKVKIVIFLMGTAIFKKVYNIFDGTKQHTA